MDKGERTDNVVARSRSRLDEHTIAAHQAQGLVLLSCCKPTVMTSCCGQNMLNLRQFHFILCLSVVLFYISLIILTVAAFAVGASAAVTVVDSPVAQ